MSVVLLATSIAAPHQCAKHEEAAHLAGTTITNEHQLEGGSLLFRHREGRVRYVGTGVVRSRCCYGVVALEYRTMLYGVSFKVWCRREC